MLSFLLFRSFVAAKDLADPLSVEACYVLTFYLLGAFGFAGVGVGAAAEAKFVHSAHHLLDPLSGFDLSLGQQCQMTYLGSDKEHGAGVLACRHTCSTTDALGGIHSHVRETLGYGDGVGIGHSAGGYADIAAGLDYLVECAAVYHEVADDREGFGTPRLYPYLVAVLEFAHVELACGDTVVVAVGTTVDVESAHSADAFATVVVETDWVGDVVIYELFIEDVEHLKE